MMNKAEDTILRRAWTRFDHATAYGCAMRGVPFNRARMLAAWGAYQGEIQEVMASRE